MACVDPCILDTLPFSGLDEQEMRRRALASRDDTDLFEHELSFVRRRCPAIKPELPSLILLPDGPATVESYDALMEALGDRFNVAVIELPGFGFSYARAAQALEFEDTCTILTLAIADLKLPRAVLVGACIQGLVAARIGELAPELFAGLIVAQTADFEGEMRWASESIDMHGNLAEPFQGQINFRLARERATVDWWSAYVAGPKLPLEDFQTQARKVLKCGCSYALASQIQKWQAMDVVPEPKPGLPSAVIWGTSDKSHAGTDKRSILRYLPDADYVERDDLGHFPDLESPQLIAEIAHALLARSR